jgi:hypothetical protein
VFNALPKKPNARTQIVAQTFENGTSLMHGIVHRINKQTVINDHSNAALYGNAIGSQCAKLMSSASTT